MNLLVNVNVPEIKTNVFAYGYWREHVHVSSFTIRLLMIFASLPEVYVIRQTES